MDLVIDPYEYNEDLDQTPQPNVPLSGSSPHPKQSQTSNDSLSMSTTLPLDNSELVIQHLNAQKEVSNVQSIIIENKC